MSFVEREKVHVVHERVVFAVIKVPWLYFLTQALTSRVPHQSGIHALGPITFGAPAQYERESHWFPVTLTGIGRPYLHNPGSLSLTEQWSTVVVVKVKRFSRPTTHL